MSVQWMYIMCKNKMLSTNDFAVHYLLLKLNPYRYRPLPISHGLQFTELFL